MTRMQAAEPKRRFGVDHMFAVPVEVYIAFSGYRYDRFDPLDAPFEELVSSRGRTPQRD